MGVLDLRNSVKAFVVIATGIFLVLCLIILVLPRLYIVQSSLEIGALLVNGKQDPIEPPDQVARQIAGPYLSSALVTLTKGIAPPAALKTLRAEAIGRLVVIQNTVPASLEQAAKDLQQKVLENAIEDRAPALRALQKRRGFELESARRLLQATKQQRNSLEDQLRRATLLADQIHEELATKPNDPTTKQAPQELQRRPDAEGPPAIIAVSSLQLRLTDLLAQADKQVEDQSKIISTIESDPAPETRIQANPTLLAAPAGPGPFYLFAAALPASALISFGLIVLMRRLRDYAS